MLCAIGRLTPHDRVGKYDPNCRDLWTERWPTCLAFGLLHTRWLLLHRIAHYFISFWAVRIPFFYFFKFLVSFTAGPNNKTDGVSRPPNRSASYYRMTHSTHDRVVTGTYSSLTLIEMNQVQVETREWREKNLLQNLSWMRRARVLITEADWPTTGARIIIIFF